MSLRSNRPASDIGLKGLAALIFSFSLLAVLYETAIAQQIGASVSRLRGGYQIVFGLAHAFYGVGMFVAYKVVSGLEAPAFSHRLRQLAWGLAGLALGSGLFALRLNVMSETWPLFAALTSLSASAAIAGFGAVHAAILVRAHAVARSSLGWLVGLSLVGLAAGFLVRSPVAVLVGNNALLLAAGVLVPVVAAPPRRAVLGTLVVMAGLCIPGVDQAIEQVRDVRDRFSVFFYSDSVPPEQVARFEPLFDGWSPYGKVNLYEVPGTPVIAGAYNYYITWVFTGRPDERRLLMFDFIEPGDRVACIAVGGGWPLQSIAEDARADVTGVELDPVVVRFLTENPDHNDRLFRDVDIEVTEGRAFLDTAQEPFDAIIFDLPGSPVTRRENPIEFESYLLTREAVARAFDLLGDHGVWLAYLLPHQSGPAVSTLLDAGLEVRVLHLRGSTRLKPIRAEATSARSAFAIYASRDGARLDRITDPILERADDAGEIINLVPLRHSFLTGFPVLTDDRPNSRFRAYLSGVATKEMRRGSYRALIVSAWTALGLSLAAALALLMGAGRRAPRAELGYFFCIGVGYILLQLVLYARARSYFGEPSATVLWVTLLLFLASAAGSVAAPRVARAKLGPISALLAVAGLLGLGLVGLSLLPFGEPSLALRFLAAAGAILPLGLVAGIFFPAGLIRSEPDSLGWLLAIDAAGTFAGFVLFHLLSWYQSISTALIPMLVCYGLAVLLWSRRR